MYIVIGKVATIGLYFWGMSSRRNDWMSDFLRENYTRMSDSDLCRAFYALSGYVVTARIMARQRRALGLQRTAGNIEELRRKATGNTT